MNNSVHVQLRDTIFKGCTRPAMILGVPLVPFVLVSGLCTLLAMWGMLLSPVIALFALALALLLIMLMRQISHFDDHRLRQWHLRLQLRLAHRSHGYWGGVSYGAHLYRSR